MATSLRRQWSAKGPRTVSLGGSGNDPYRIDVRIPRPRTARPPSSRKRETLSSNHDGEEGASSMRPTPPVSRRTSTSSVGSVASSAWSVGSSYTRSTRPSSALNALSMYMDRGDAARGSGSNSSNVKVNRAVSAGASRTLRYVPVVGPGAVSPPASSRPRWSAPADRLAREIGDGIDGDGNDIDSKGNNNDNNDNNTDGNGNSKVDSSNNRGVPSFSRASLEAAAGPPPERLEGISGLSARGNLRAIEVARLLNGSGAQTAAQRIKGLADLGAFLHARMAEANGVANPKQHYPLIPPSLAMSICDEANAARSKAWEDEKVKLERQYKRQLKNKLANGPGKSKKKAMNGASLNALINGLGGGPTLPPRPAVLPMTAFLHGEPPAIKASLAAAKSAGRVTEPEKGNNNNNNGSRHGFRAQNAAAALTGDPPDIEWMIETMERLKRGEAVVRQPGGLSGAGTGSSLGLTESNGAAGDHHAAGANGNSNGGGGIDGGSVHTSASSRAPSGLLSRPGSSSASRPTTASRSLGKKGRGGVTSRSSKGLKSGGKYDQPDAGSDDDDRESARSDEGGDGSLTGATRYRRHRRRRGPATGLSEQTERLLGKYRAHPELLKGLGKEIKARKRAKRGVRLPTHVLEAREGGGGHAAHSSTPSATPTPTPTPAMADQAQNDTGNPGLTISRSGRGYRSARDTFGNSSAGGAGRAGLASAPSDLGHRPRPHPQRDIVADNALALRGVTKADLERERVERLRKREEWCDRVWLRSASAGRERPDSRANIDTGRGMRGSSRASHRGNGGAGAERKSIHDVVSDRLDEHAKRREDALAQEQEEENKFSESAGFNVGEVITDFPVAEHHSPHDPRHHHGHHHQGHQGESEGRHAEFMHGIAENGDPKAAVSGSGSGSGSGGDGENSINPAGAAKGSSAPDHQ